MPIPSQIQPNHTEKTRSSPQRAHNGKLALDTPPGTRVRVALSSEVEFYTTTSADPEVLDGVLVVRCVGIPRPVPALACEVTP